MNPVNATALYVSACRSVLRCDPRDPQALSELYKLLPFFRQSLSCLVCGTLTSGLSSFIFTLLRVHDTPPISSLHCTRTAYKSQRICLAAYLSVCDSACVSVCESLCVSSAEACCYSHYPTVLSVTLRLVSLLSVVACFSSACVYFFSECVFRTG